MTKFSIIITTKNRLQDLIFTLNKIKHLLERSDVECIICDDGSTDGTFEYISEHHKEIKLIRNEHSKGLIHSRNVLMGLTRSDYIISIDDDLHFLVEKPLEKIEGYFLQYPECGVVGFRLFWGKEEPRSYETEDVAIRVKSFAGGANAIRKSSWDRIPNFPGWFIFHGEENFAAYNMFKEGIEIHYVPDILVHHRVDMKARRKDKDYVTRLQRSLHSGWCLYFLFFPWKQIPKHFLSSIYHQLKLKVFKGQLGALWAMILAFFRMLSNIPNIIKNKNRLSQQEFDQFNELEPAKIYWFPKE